MNKTIVVFVITVFNVLYLNAQRSENETNSFSFGAKIGINISSVTTPTSGVSSSIQSLTGPVAGLFVQYNVSKSFAIQPELNYVGAGFGFSTVNTIATINLNYLYIPILAKYTIPHSGFALYAGPQLGLLLTAKDNQSGESTNIKSSFKNTDFDGVVGIEYEFDFGVNISARYASGLSNIASTSAFGSTKTTGLEFSLGYKFK